MSSVYQRLVEISKAIGIDQGRGLDRRLAEIAGVSSSRISQLRSTETAKIGAEAQARLTAAGWNPEWVMNNKLPKRLKDVAAPNPLTQEQQEWLEVLAWLMPAERQQVIDLAARNKEIASTLGKGGPPVTPPPHRRTGTR